MSTSTDPAAAAASEAADAASSAVAAASSAIAAASSAAAAALSANSGFQFTNFSNGYFAWYLGGNNNTTQGENGLLAIQLDLVGFLAILGEGSILANAEVASLSWFTFLPRIMPAPQALLRPSRATKLASHPGYTTAVASGNTRHYLNYVSQVVVEAESLPRHSVRCLKIERQYRPKTKPRAKGGGRISTDGSLTAKIWGPLTFVTLLGTSLSLMLLVLAVWHHDGFALCGDICLSFLSTLTGLANKWKLKLQKRQNRGIRMLPGDVVIRYLNGNFLCIECDENVARELYFAPEGIDYLVSDLWRYRIISLFGTILLIFGVIFLANSSTWMQLIFAGAFVALNISYWLVAALPSRVHWDTTCFKVTESAIERYDTKTGELSLPTPRLHKEGKFVDLNSDYTWAVWKAILVTKETNWVETSGAIPNTDAWKDWLREARDKAAEAKVRYETIGGVEVKVFEHPKWDPKKAWDACQEASMNDVEKAEPSVVQDSSPNTLSLRSETPAANNV